MKYIITNTTDHQFEGHIIEYDGSMQLSLTENNIMFIEKKISIKDKELRLANSNYSIDIKEVI